MRITHLKGVRFMDFWVQAIGIVAMAINIISYQFKSKRNILLCMCVGSALFSVNMIMLGAMTGGIMNILSVVRSLVYMNKDKLRISIKIVNALFVAAYLMSYVLSFALFGAEPSTKNFILELLPVIAMSAMTIAFSGKNAKIIRLSGFISSPSWLVYNIFNHSIGGILCEVFGLVSIISSLIRMDLIGKKVGDDQKNTDT